MTVAELKKKAKEAKIKNWWLMTKAELEACLKVTAEESRVINVVAATIPASQIVAAGVTLADVHETTPEDADGKKLNQVPVSPQGEHESVEDYIARGGKITVIPTIEFPAPKAPRESSAMKANPDMPKRTPRKVARKDSAFHAEISAEVNAKPERKRPTTTKPNKGTEVKETRRVTGGKSPNAQQVKKPVSPDVVTLASLTEGRDIEGRILRRMLRNSDIEKPGTQWEWPTGHDDIAKVKALIDKRWI